MLTLSAFAPALDPCQDEVEPLAFLPRNAPFDGTRSVCRRLIVTDDSRRLGLARDGLLLARPGQDAILPAAEEIPPLSLAVGISVILRGEHAAMVLRKPGVPGTRAVDTQCRTVARLIQRLNPVTIELGAQHLWLSPEFAGTIGASVITSAEEVHVGGADVDLTHGSGRAAWSLMVALNAGPHAAPSYEQARMEACA
jgi:hypothetical protein